MPVPYPNIAELYSDNFTSTDNWHHEGAGDFEVLPGGKMHLKCLGSRQGSAGCMAFFRPTLPDQIAVEYDILIRSQGGLVINYLAIRGINGEDMIADRDSLPPRTGIMANYWHDDWKLQSYHVSFSRYNDKAEHTGTSNWRRNPGLLLVGHGIDPVNETNRSYHMRVVKDRGHCQVFVDGEYAHGFVDRDGSRPIPDTGKFGFRLIGKEVEAEVENFKIFRVSDENMEWDYLRKIP